ALGAGHGSGQGALKLGPDAWEMAPGWGGAANEPAMPAPARPADPPHGNPLWGIPLSGLSATRGRPIFSPTRRPPAPAVFAVAAAGPAAAPAPPPEAGPPSPPPGRPP